MTTSSREHTNREYEQELRKLREQVLRMGAKVEEIISGSIKALLERDTVLATRMIAFDRKINQMEIDIDELCMVILARRQPVASDLRFITMALKLVTDLERIGALGVNISERVVELNDEPQLKPYVDLPRMADEVQSMLREALDAFVAGDPDRAQAVIERDKTVDAYYTQVFRELLTYMMEDTHNIYRATRLQSIAKYLERIGDHATNLAEMVVFMVKGKDIRHTGKLEGERAGGCPPRPGPAIRRDAASGRQGGPAGDAGAAQAPEHARPGHRVLHREEHGVLAAQRPGDRDDPALGARVLVRRHIAGERRAATNGARTERLPVAGGGAGPHRFQSISPCHGDLPIMGKRGAHVPIWLTFNALKSFMKNATAPSLTDPCFRSPVRGFCAGSYRQRAATKDERNRSSGTVEGGTNGDAAGHSPAIGSGGVGGQGASRGSDHSGADAGRGSAGVPDGDRHRARLRPVLPDRWR